MHGHVHNETFKGETKEKNAESGRMIKPELTHKQTASENTLRGRGDELRSTSMSLSHHNNISSFFARCLRSAHCFADMAQSESLASIARSFAGAAIEDCLSVLTVGLACSLSFGSPCDTVGISI